jgi:hypothetical protein
MKKNIIITIVVAIVVGAGAFFGGMKYQQGKTASQFRQFAGGRLGQGTRGGNAQGFRPVNGDIISADNNSITVKMSDGSSKIVILTDNTAISQSSSAGKLDLKVGEKVAVFGTANSDGSVTAQNVQINPVERNPQTQNPN